MASRVPAEPDLIESFIQRKMRRLLMKKSEPTFFEKACDFIKMIWYTYIGPYKWTWLLLILVGMFLYHRYLLTQEEKKKAEEKKKQQQRQPIRKIQRANTGYNSSYSEDDYVVTTGYPQMNQYPDRVQSMNSDNYSYGQAGITRIQVPVSLNDFYTVPYTSMIEAPYAE